MSEAMQSTGILKTPADRLRNYAAFIRAGSFSPDDAGWFSEALAKVAEEIEGAPPASLPDEGEWSEDGKLTLTAAYYDQPNRVYLSLLLTGDADATEAEVAAWTPEQRKAAAEWAISAHTSASDNDDVVVPPRPAFIRRTP